MDPFGIDSSEVDAFLQGQLDAEIEQLCQLASSELDQAGTLGKVAACPLGNITFPLSAAALISADSPCGMACVNSCILSDPSNGWALEAAAVLDVAPASPQPGAVQVDALVPDVDNSGRASETRRGCAAHAVDRAPHPPANTQQHQHNNSALQQDSLHQQPQHCLPQQQQQQLPALPAKDAASPVQPPAAPCSSLQPPAPLPGVRPPAAPPRQRQRLSRSSEGSLTGNSSLSGHAIRHPSLRVQSGSNGSSRPRARHKQQLARLEAEVAAKLAQLQLLQSDHAALMQRQHVLDTMLGDTQHLLALAAGTQQESVIQQLCEQQLLALPAARGAAAAADAAPRPLKVLFQKGLAINPAAWTLEQARQRWQAFVDQLRPLLQQVEEAQAHHAAEQAAQQATQSSRPSRRAAAAAATRISAMAQQIKAEDSLLEGPAGPSTTAPGGAGGGPGLAPGSYSCCWPPAGEVGGQLVYGGPGTQGIPLQLLAQVEALVLDNMSWLAVLATSACLDKYCFFAADLDGRSRAPPARHSPFWRRVVAAMRLTPAQLAECATSLEVATRCSHKVYAERAELTPALAPPVTLATPGPEYSLEAHMARMDIGLAAADHMQRNLTKEEVAMHLVGMYQFSVFSLLQLGRGAVATWPWVPSPWSVFEAAEQLHKEQQGWWES